MIEGINMKNLCSIIYNTCDKYECLWEGFFTLLNRYWQNCDLSIVLNTEEKNCSFFCFNIIRPKGINTGVSWSQRIINSLNSINTPYVIMVLDDFYLKRTVDVKEISHCIDLMEQDKNIKCINFAPQPGPNKNYKKDTKYEKRGRFAPYRINAQIALWRVDYLKSILRSYETAWQFEISGSFRSSLRSGTFLSIKQGDELPFVYDYGFLIVRGKINKKVAEYFEKNEGIEIDHFFEEYDEKVYYDNKKGKTLRLFKYLKDSVVSLFRK